MLHSTVLPLSAGSTISNNNVEQIEEITSLICHEMRTPLTSIQGVLKLLDYEQFGNLSDDGLKLLKLAIGGADRLTRLVDFLEHHPDLLPAILSAEDIENFKLEKDIAGGLKRREFFLNYQPIISVLDNRIIGFEALARWQHPTQGLISPTTFIPLSEKTGQIKELELYLLRMACQQLQDWQAGFCHDAPIMMSINLSSSQLSEPDLCLKVKDILSDYTIIPNTLKLEITESFLIGNQNKALENIVKLKELGVKFYIDDFGTGYSSLARLQDFPFDAIKIDRSFISNQNWVMSEAILALASRLNLDVIAEGIETPAQLDKMKQIGCRKMQGYHFSMPVDSLAAAQFLLKGI
ncbi:MAG: EAL domain-containing protein [Thainema sp.]